jgi:hypothetical protein
MRPNTGEEQIAGIAKFRFAAQDFFGAAQIGVTGRNAANQQVKLG